MHGSNRETEHIVLLVAHALRHRLLEAYAVKVQLYLRWNDVLVGLVPAQRRVLGLFNFNYQRPLYSVCAVGLWAEVLLEDPTYHSAFFTVLHASASVHRIVIHLLIECEDGSIQRQILAPSYLQDIRITWPKNLIGKLSDTSRCGSSSPTVKVLQRF